MNKKYKMVPSSRGLAPRFEVTSGLAEGYGPSAKLHRLEEAVEVIAAHLKECAAAGRPFLSGRLVAGEVVYAWRSEGGQAGSGHEPAAVYSGEVNPLYNASMSDQAIEAFLEGLAAAIGSALGQTRIYISLAGEMWILQREEAETPTGETV